MYYSNGNYEAFARPEKPEGVDRKSAYLVGSGLASLAAACFLIRDGQMKDKHDPNYSLMRASVNREEDAHTDGKFELRILAGS